MKKWIQAIKAWDKRLEEKAGGPEKVERILKKWAPVARILATLVLFGGMVYMALEECIKSFRSAPAEMVELFFRGLEQDEIRNAMVLFCFAMSVIMFGLYHLGVDLLKLVDRWMKPAQRRAG